MKSHGMTGQQSSWYCKRSFEPSEGGPCRWPAGCLCQRDLAPAVPFLPAGMGGMGGMGGFGAAGAGGPAGSMNCECAGVAGRAWTLEGCTHVALPNRDFLPASGPWPSLCLAAVTLQLCPSATTATAAGMGRFGCSRGAFGAGGAGKGMGEALHASAAWFWGTCSAPIGPTLRQIMLC